MLDRGVRFMTDFSGLDYPYSKVSSTLKESDITFGNLECPLTYGGTPAQKNILFKADPENAKALYAAGYDVLSISNNHMMDYRVTGMEDTIKALSNNNILPVDNRLTVIERQGIRIGFIGYTFFMKEDIDSEALKNQIQKARLECNFLVISFHTGLEYNPYPTEMQREYSHLFIDSGADMVVGHHPHVLQGMERYKEKYIFYSLGNFIFDRQLQEGTDKSVILSVKIDKNGIKNIEALPVKIIKCRPEIIEGPEGRRIAEQFKY